MCIRDSCICFIILCFVLWMSWNLCPLFMACVTKDVRVPFFYVYLYKYVQNNLFFTYIKFTIIFAVTRWCMRFTMKNVQVVTEAPKTKVSANIREHRSLTLDSLHISFPEISRCQMGTFNSVWGKQEKKNVNCLDFSHTIWQRHRQIFGTYHDWWWDMGLA